VFLGIFIGAVTFTGSIVAFGKLRGKISSKPLMLPNRHKLNLAALVVSFVLLVSSCVPKAWACRCWRCW
jgi:NAD(P) transhydrogenase subunit beta